MGSLVGMTEERTRQALRIADAMAPCLVFIDEIEKGLSGVQASGQADSGVSARMFGTLLSYLNDHESDVYFVCSANDVSKLPPEFTRAERFDAIFFLDLPGSREKELIWRLYLERYGLDPAQRKPADRDFTGAEIRACCRLAALARRPARRRPRRTSSRWPSRPASRSNACGTGPPAGACPQTGRASTRGSRARSGKPDGTFAGRIPRPTDLASLTPDHEKSEPPSGLLECHRVDREIRDIPSPAVHRARGGYFRDYRGHCGHTTGRWRRRSRSSLSCIEVVRDDREIREMDHPPGPPHFAPCHRGQHQGRAASRHGDGKHPSWTAGLPAIPVFFHTLEELHVRSIQEYQP